jgi:hypothetical protein
MIVILGQGWLCAYAQQCGGGQGCGNSFPVSMLISFYFFLPGS